MLASKFRWAAALAAIALAGCDSAQDLEVEAEYPSDRPPYSPDPDDRLFGRDGLVLFGGPDYEAAEAAPCVDAGAAGATCAP